MRMIQDIRTALERRDVPTVVLWNRLEGRPRTADFERALRAEVRDALWMIARQWQVGEFRGDDAGSPIGAKVHMDTTRLTKLSAGDGVERYDEAHPLEARVERQPIVFERGGEKLHMDLRLQIARQWRRLLAATTALSKDYEPDFRARYGFALPPRNRDASATYAHAEAWQYSAFAAGRCVDGGDLLLHLREPGAHASDGIVLSDPADGPLLDGLGDELLSWFASLYDEPPGGGDGAWQPSRLEYGFECSAPVAGGEKRLVADEYPGGHLDWYTFDGSSGALAEPASPPPPDVQKSETRSFLPAPAAFDGMPNARWWKFEDAKVNLGEVAPSTTDLAKLLLVEFALLYSNDWFLLPFKLAAGTLAKVRGLVVTNSFGERLWIDPAGQGLDDTWHTWRMFEISSRDERLADTTLMLAPAVPKIQEGDPLEEVNLVRDEMANMVWGIETRVPLVTGGSKRGRETSREVLAYHRSLIEAAPGPEPAYVAPIHYRAMSQVPENWIPFVPVHVPGSNREIQLQRGSMLRVLERDPLDPQPVKPLTVSLRRGLDESPRQSYFVHEEEVPRSGTTLAKSFQRTRWRGGRAVVWLGYRRDTGRGEASSELTFDDIPSTPGS
jgi:hypothetical protein